MHIFEDGVAPRSGGLCVVALCILGIGCVHSSTPNVSSQIPEASPSASIYQGARFLEESAGNLHPSYRGLALYHLIEGSPSAEVANWIDRALYDPDPWVNRQGVLAILARGDEDLYERIEGFVGRQDADPYVRSMAALRLGELSSETKEVLMSDWRGTNVSWRRAPLALAALHWGDQEAMTALAADLSGGELALDVEFMADVGSSGQGDLVAALRKGTPRVEEELEISYLAARFILGDAEAMAPLREAILGKHIERGLESLDYLKGAYPGMAKELFRRARRQGEKEVRDFASLVIDLDQEAWRGFQEVMDQGEASTRQDGIQLIEAWLREGNKASLDILGDIILEGTRDVDPAVRTAAVRNLYFLKKEDALRALSPFFEDESLMVRIAAAGVCVKIPECVVRTTSPIDP